MFIVVTLSAIALLGGLLVLSIYVSTLTILIVLAAIIAPLLILLIIDGIQMEVEYGSYPVYLALLDREDDEGEGE